MRSQLRYVDEPTLFASAEKLLRRLREHPERVMDESVAVRFRTRERAKFIAFTVGTLTADQEATGDRVALAEMELLTADPLNWTSAQLATSSEEQLMVAVRGPDSVRSVAVVGPNRNAAELLAFGLACDVDWVTHERALRVLADLSENPYRHLLKDILRG